MEAWLLAIFLNGVSAKGCQSGGFSIQNLEVINPTGTPPAPAVETASQQLPRSIVPTTFFFTPFKSTGYSKNHQALTKIGQTTLSPT